MIQLTFEESYSQQHFSYVTNFWSYFGYLSGNQKYLDFWLNMLYEPLKYDLNSLGIVK
jgi:hypothetical protein